MAFGIVYCITCLITGKRYIGQTTGSLSRRWAVHKRCATHGYTGAIYRAIHKYGVENFTICQIDSADSPEDLNRKEVFHITSKDTVAPNGYNLTVGGEGAQGFRHSEETREKISEAVARQAHPRKLYCKYGHLLDESSLYTNPSTNHRSCLICYYIRRARKLPKRLERYIK